MKCIQFLLVGAVVLLSWECMAAGSCDEAVQLYQKGLTLSDNSKQEITFYKKAIKLCPELVEAHNRLGQIYRKKGSDQLIIRQLEVTKSRASSSLLFNCVEDSPDPLDVTVGPCKEAWEWYQKGLLLSNGSDQEISHYEKAIKLCPELIDAYNRLGQIYKKKGSDQLIIRQLEVAKAWASSNPLLKSRNEPSNSLGVTVMPCDEAWQWYQKGRALSDDSELEISFYEKAVQLCPELVDAHNRLGQIYKKRGDYQLVVKQLEVAKVQALSNPQFNSRAGSLKLLLEPFIALGEAYRLQGRYEEAMAEFTKALELYPDSLEAQNNLQYIYKRLHKYDTALPMQGALLTNAIFTRVPGTTLPKGGLLFDIFYRRWYQEGPLEERMFDDDRVILSIPPTERSGFVEVVEAGIRYGLTNELTIGLIPKYFLRGIEVDLEEAWDETIWANVYGFGDTVFLVKYQLWGQRRAHLSLYNLLTIPTGSTNAKGGTDEVWRWVPLGSGSYDFAPGIAFTTEVGNVVTMHTNMHYLFTDGEEVGDEFRANLAFVYPFAKAAYASLELNYRWRRSVRRRQHTIVYKQRPDFIGSMPAGPEIVDTEYTEGGGHTLFISPGIKFDVGKGMKVEIGLQIPAIVQDDGWVERTVFHLGFSKVIF